MNNYVACVYTSRADVYRGGPKSLLTTTISHSVKVYIIINDNIMKGYVIF